VFVPAEEAERTLAILGDEARQIGVVLAGADHRVTLKSTIGVTRIMDMLSGEQLPRIC
jgi:hydrogenase expression/formation protein HypE